ncbi:MAG: Omp28-related outer membrane protein [Bacteroidota bacterium]|nr:Omp28-related outer membrane protein [Bacteroidota bacterium]
MAHSSTFKRVIFVVAALVLLFISSLDLRAQTTYKRHALIEEVTGQWCGYCPLGAWYMDSIHTYMPDNAVIISWHNQDDMESQDSKTFHANFGVSSWPGAFLNRYYLFGFGEVTSAQGYQEVQFGQNFGLFQQAATFAKQASPVDFRLVNVQYVSSTRTLDFDVDVTPVTASSLPTEDTAQYMVLAVLTEDGIQAYQHDYGLDGNDNPSDIDPFTHNDVGRKSISSVAGDNITLGLKIPTTALPIRKHYSIAINAAWNADKIKVKAAIFAAAPKNKSPKTDYVFDAGMTKDYVTTYPEQAPAAEWVVLPTAKTTVSGKTPLSIVWARGGSTSTNAKLDYTVDGGVTWNPIIASTSQSPYAWTIPQTAFNKTAQIRVSDATSAAISGVSEPFLMPNAPTPGTMTITKPAAGDVLTGGASYSIMMTESNLAAPITFEYSVDGTTWSPIGSLNVEGNTISWSVPNVASTMATVRATDANSVKATSGVFSITKTTNAGAITSVKVNNLDINSHIANDVATTVTWTTNGGNVGANLIVEYSMDNGTTWTAIGSPVLPTVTSVDWTTPATGYSASAFVRVRSADADKQTVSGSFGPFTIGQSAGVYMTSANGYSITNYPNPFGGATTIKFELPIRTYVTIRIQDELGREIDKLVTENLDAGVHMVPYNAANLSAGIYTYTLEAGATKLVGKMSVVK